VSEALRQEGVARELVNRIQNIRKTSGYEITDKISVNIEAREEITEAVENHKDYIASQVLATSLCVVEKIDNPTPLDFEDFVVNIFIEKA
jgi:isoleucyl-tRNA synthetase